MRRPMWHYLCWTPAVLSPFVAAAIARPMRLGLVAEGMTVDGAVAVQLIAACGLGIIGAAISITLWVVFAK